MTYLEKFESTNSNENLSWCKPYTDKNNEYYLIQHDGEIIDVKTPTGEYNLYDGTLTAEIMESIARAVNSDYDCYKGWTDEHIAIDAMTEIGCACCPFRHVCEAANEEIETIDEDAEEE